MLEPSKRMYNFTEICDFKGIHIEFRSKFHNTYCIPMKSLAENELYSTNLMVNLMGILEWF